ncbi:sugar transporter domain-containing protein [Phthorimaea operculella]|nr:sugar transporter domain-containing protein [Phthorimaea operculella]
MSEVDLSALANNDSYNASSKLKTPMQEINLALKECGFGWFHIRLLCASYFGFSAGVSITNSVPYILPNAECDLDMDLIRKGYLTAVPYIGMIISSIVAGFLVDTFGRKIFLVGGYFMMGCFNFVSAMSQSYNMLLFSKLCEGIVFAVAFSPTMTLTSEFCHQGIRDRVMLTQSSFAPSNQVLLAVLSWAILLKDWKLTLFDGYFVLNTWNIYLLIMTIFAATACLMYSFIPESPKYLITQNRYDEARETLCNIYRINTGKPIDTFKYANLWKEKISAITEEPEHPKTSLGKQLTAGLHNVKPLFKKPYVTYLLIICIMIFFVMCLYNVIRMWFPQLSTVVEHYATEENQELCRMLDDYTHDQLLKSLNKTVVEVCVPVVALFATVMSLGQVMMSLLQATTMECFPTAFRTLAISVTMTIGRIGSLVGNILFPILLNMGCVVPFYSLAGVMVVVTLMAIIQPNKKKT